MAVATALIWVTCPTDAQGQSLLIVPQIFVFFFPLDFQLYYISNLFLQLDCFQTMLDIKNDTCHFWEGCFAASTVSLARWKCIFFSAKSRSVNILAFEGHRVSPATTDTP